MLDLSKPWGEQFKELPKKELDYLLDTTALNKKMADRADNPYRWRSAGFLVNKSASMAQKEAEAKIAVAKWIEIEAKKGWTLESKVQVYKPGGPALDLATGAVLLDRESWEARGIFKTKPQPLRLELPKGMVRQDPEQKLSLREALKL